MIGAKDAGIVCVIGIVCSIAMIFVMGEEISDLIIYLIGMVCCIPMICLGVYMMSTAKDERWINGPNWHNLEGKERDDKVAGFGLMVTIFGIIFGISTSAILANFIIGMIGIAIAVVLLLIPFKKKPIYRFKPLDRRVSVSIMAVCMVATIVPSAFVATMDGASNEVAFTYDDTGFSVKAPMFKHDFGYDEIDGLTYVEDFEKGTRSWGYASGKICSGTFENKTFGKYELASYAKVDPCICFSVNGHMYAFNLSSVEATEEAYQTISSHI